MTLYEINAELKEAIDAMFASVDENGEMDAQAVERFKSLEEERKEKLDNIGAFIKNEDAEINAISDEIDKLKARLDAKKKHVEWLKNYVTADMQSQNETSFESTRVRFSFRTSERVVVDENRLPKKYFIKKITHEPDKAALKELLKGGQSIKGAEIVKRYNLQIK